MSENSFNVLIYSSIFEEENENGIESLSLNTEEIKGNQELDYEKLPTKETNKRGQPLKPELNPINQQNLNDKDLDEIKKNEDLPKIEVEMITVMETKIKTKKKLGRKRKDSNEKGDHDKYSQDNLIRKIKATLITNLSLFINSLILKIYNGNIGNGIFRKEFFKMVQNQIIKGKKDKEFLVKKLEDIFSEDISSKFTLYPKNHNKKLVEKLLNENDEIKRDFFKQLFSLTFLDCLKHYRGDEYIEELQGLKTLDEECKNFEDNEEYIELFRKNVFEFEKIIERKKTRNTKHDK